jgi:hypothetical protein
MIAILLSVPALVAAKVNLRWDANSEDDLLGYIVYYGTVAREYRSDIYVGNVTSYVLERLQGGQTWYFAVTALDYSGNESDFSEEVSTFVEVTEEELDPDDPEDEEIESQALSAYSFPNPLRIGERTTIRYQLETASRITIEIFDMREQRIATLISDVSKGPGEHTEDSWDGTNSHGQFVANGIYLCRIRSESISEVIKIAVTR